MKRLNEAIELSPKQINELLCVQKKEIYLPTRIAGILIIMIECQHKFPNRVLISGDFVDIFKNAGFENIPYSRILDHLKFLEGEKLVEKIKNRFQLCTDYKNTIQQLEIDDYDSESRNSRFKIKVNLKNLIDKFNKDLSTQENMNQILKEELKPTKRIKMTYTKSEKIANAASETPSDKLPPMFFDVFKDLFKTEKEEDMLKEEYIHFSS